MIKTTLQDGIATIAFDRPEALNALTRETGTLGLAALQGAIRDGARAVILTGNGRAFCAGADLAVAGQLVNDATPDGEEDIGLRMQETLNPLAQAISSSPVPVISAVNGACVGGGAGLALAADMVLAARSAYFQLPQVPVLGFVPDLGATWQLPRMIGRSRAFGMSLLGERITAEQAQAWGLVWKCVDDAVLMDEAMALARRLSAISPDALRAMRELFDAAPDATLPDQLEQERLVQMKLLHSPFFREACARFAAGSRKNQ
ncbi:enoyl-CoA hydratase [Variovorax sp. KBW07]|uniref:enoyl-CoA hydratase/isomerase family protein n=1 Tax=Variovorax sp. KBW07 TaxID=2153358 RepID=UPI000F55D200|nr:enoyl-CoA hydratase-related protein [Variovorax sp. KBW07]RQO61247.1 enoyl-CoA hydratase [Variovorax sp. KBW07]